MQTANRSAFLDYDSYNNDFWFSRIDSVCGRFCNEQCTDNLTKWTIGRKNKGMRIPMTHLLGEGGFGQVYRGRLHGMKIAAKMITITGKIKTQAMENALFDDL